MRRSLLAVLTIALAFGGMGPVDAKKGTRCSGEFLVTITPGLSMEETSGTHDTGDKPGTAECDGPVNGKKPTGTGTLKESGSYEASTCRSGKGDGTDILEIPTTGGVQKVVSDFTFTYGGPPRSPRGLAAGEFKGSRFTGRIEFTPTKGDCFSSPVTEARVFFEGVIHD